ncbi:MAG TPA: hypothetical protein VHW65_06440, partial [Gemmatimonadales bacterium]|nr:hypothetical protein [Gemmatimonadales bacterium]
GPEVGIRTGCSVSNGTCDGSSDQITSFDYGFMLGVGISVQRFSASIRYDDGLADLNPHTDVGETVYKNRALFVLVGVHF